MMQKSYITPDWPAPASIKAYTTTRLGGFSEKPGFESFNLSHYVGDTESAVQANRQKLREELQLPHDPFWLDQVHGTEVVELTPQTVTEKIIADAAFTHHPQIVCAIMTADCLPILLCDRAGMRVAAVHAGWRGLVAGVIENTITQMGGKDLIAWIGPAIGPTAYVVDEVVRNPFVKADADAEKAFELISPNQWRANLPLLATQRLQKMGVQHISGGKFCTYQDNGRFYSFRRGQKNTGRMATLIWMGT